MVSIQRFGLFVIAASFVACATREIGAPTETSLILREPQAYGVPWVIAKDSWNESDEAKFSEFVQGIYESGCSKVDACLKGSGNPYRGTDPRGVTWWADCSRWPYLLRSYFAWKNNLPFQSAADAEPVDPEDPNNTDRTNRYTAAGNLISARFNNITPAGGAPVDGVSRIMKMVEASFTSVQRTDARLEYTKGGSDFYHVSINRKYIRPGTVYYDPNGHVAVVAKIKDNGGIVMMDAHPDNTVTRIAYDAAFVASSPVQGGGFRNWRPLKLVGAQQGYGGLVGGKITAPLLADTPGYSLEQFYGNEPGNTSFAKAKFKTEKEVFTSRQFTDFVRARLSKGDVIYRPVDELTEGLTTLCQVVKDRVQSVQEAVAKGIDKQMHPDRLPDNIYGTSGEWESYSSPSRDARLKAAAADLYNHTAEIIELYRNRSPKVDYKGQDLTGDLLTAYRKVTAACTLAYANSEGSKVNLNLDSVFKRMYKMSFDPYHCVELRWGASSDNELASCATNSGVKRAWYDAEQRLRNQIERTYSEKMSNGLDGLVQKKPGSGVDVAPNVNIEALLTNSR